MGPKEAKSTRKLVTAFLSLYMESKSRVKAMVGKSQDIDIRVGVHQGSVLSPVISITVMEEASKMALEDSPEELIFADDLMLTSESKEDVIAKLTDGMMKRNKGS